MAWFHGKSREEQYLGIIQEFHHLINQKLNKMGDQLSALQAANEQFAKDFEALRTQNATIIQALKDKIAAGGGATDADLQGMLAQVTGLDNEAKSDLAAGAGSAGAQETDFGPATGAGNGTAPAEAAAAQ